jgi:hypothetical protein
MQATANNRLEILVYNTLANHYLHDLRGIKLHGRGEGLYLYQEKISS